VGFNLGIEIGQLLFVVMFMPVLMLLKRGRGVSLTPQIASLAVVIIGAYWLTERMLAR
jgi:hypothetical protein